MILLVVCLIFLFAILGTPLFVIIGGIALMLFLQTGEHMAGVLLSIFKLASSPTLIAIPLFTFAGYLMAESHTPQRLVRLARAVVVGAQATALSWAGVSGVHVCLRRVPFLDRTVA